MNNTQDLCKDVERLTRERGETLASLSWWMAEAGEHKHWRGVLADKLDLAESKYIRRSAEFLELKAQLDQLKEVAAWMAERKTHTTAAGACSCTHCEMVYKARAAITRIEGE